MSGFYLKYIQAILPETSPFLSAQMAVLSIFFQMFIVLGMYNFGRNVASLKALWFSQVCWLVTKLRWWCSLWGYWPREICLGSKQCQNAQKSSACHSGYEIQLSWVDQSLQINLKIRKQFHLGTMIIEAKTECYAKDKVKSPPFFRSFYDNFQLFF